MQKTFECHSSIYIDLIRSNLYVQLFGSSLLYTYCSTVWNDGNKKNSEKLYKMQKRAARTITSSSHEIASKTIFRTLGWSPRRIP